MSDMERLVNFELLGQQFKFYTAASEEEMNEILSLIRAEVEAGSAGDPRATLPASKIAVMACLNIASKYIQLKQEMAEYKTDTENRFLHLSELIKSSLQVD